MKGALTTLVIAFLLLSPSVLSAAEKTKTPTITISKETEIVLSKIEEERQFVALVRDIVPDKFQDDFLLETQDWSIRKRTRALAQAEVESLGWLYMQSIQANANGSVDLGPLGLNSRNLENPDFVASYWPRDRLITDKDVLYMVVCLRYIDKLVDQFGIGNSMLVAYNAGPDAALGKRDVPEITVYYIRKVNRTQAEISKNYYARLAMAVAAIKRGVMNPPPLPTKVKASESKEIADSSLLFFAGFFYGKILGDYRRNQVVHKITWTKVYDWWEVLIGLQDNVAKTNAGEHQVLFLI